MVGMRWEWKWSCARERETETETLIVSMFTIFVPFVAEDALSWRSAFYLSLSFNNGDASIT